MSPGALSTALEMDLVLVVFICTRRRSAAGHSRRGREVADQPLTDDGGTALGVALRLALSFRGSLAPMYMLSTLLRGGGWTAT